MNERSGLRTVAAVLAGLAFAACGGGAGGADTSTVPTCSPVPTIAPPGDLPPKFPSPDGVSYTSAEKAGPSTILEGRWDGATLEGAFEDYKTAFGEAGYQITDEEREVTDAEVNFAGGGTTGQVRLNSRTCAGVLMVGITIRPS